MVKNSKIEYPSITGDSLKEFLEKKPLLIWLRRWVSPNESDFPYVDIIDMHCDSCNTNRPFKSQETKRDYLVSVPSGGGPPPPPIPSTMTLSFQCQGCPKGLQKFYLEISYFKPGIRKIGQYPPWSISLEKPLEKFLGEHSKLMKNGVICESQGYGIGAFAYYRRVLEEKIEGILEDIKRLLVTLGNNEHSIDLIKKAIASHQMEDKINIAKDGLPGNLRPEGINPLTIIYQALSRGIHAKTDEECIDQAIEIRECLSFLIETLHTQGEKTVGYLEAIKKIKKRSDS